jgi:exodeoxyribonuclease-3
MDMFLQHGWIDSYRSLHPEITGGYTWWSQRFPSVRLENKGWRIDYICMTDKLAPKLKSAAIYPTIKHSDHCPIYMELK